MVIFVLGSIIIILFFMLIPIMFFILKNLNYTITKAAGLTRCVFPKGLMNGHCVECPVDTLYE